MHEIHADKNAEAEKLIEEYQEKLQVEESKRHELEVLHAEVIKDMEKTFQEKLASAKEDLHILSLDFTLLRST